MCTTARCRAAAMALLSVSVLAAGCTGHSAPAAPGIEIGVIPPGAGGGQNDLAPIAGRVVNARRGDVVVLFAKSNVWWVQPFRSRPFTSIAADSTWNTKIHLGTE